ncbi:MAG: hypothetical protein Q9199_007535 [Rusavskia elegans]
MSEPSDHNASDSVSPTPEKSRGRNDSLWKRARRTLGTNSLTFLQPQGKPQPASKEGNGSVSGQGKTTPGKRREQVRQAQRTHRQRTQNYIKTLEEEVVRLRGSEGDLKSENKKLFSQVGVLRTALILANVPLPAGFEGSPQLAQLPSLDSELPASISFRTDSSNHQRLHVDWPTQSHSQPASAPASTPAPQAPTGGFAPGDFHGREDWIPQDKPLPIVPNDTLMSPLGFDSTYENPQPQMASKILDTPEVAVDFVLALEHVCMGHIPHPANPPSDEPTNHALLMSTALIARGPGPPQLNSSWSADGSMIKGLLNLASAINLQGEITPVEAWHRLRQYPGFSSLDKWTFEMIKTKLSASVQCREFGAVIDEERFLFTLGSVLGPPEAYSVQQKLTIQGRY